MTVEDPTGPDAGCFSGLPKDHGGHPLNLMADTKHPGMGQRIKTIEGLAQPLVGVGGPNHQLLVWIAHMVSPAGSVDGTRADTRSSTATTALMAVNDTAATIDEALAVSHRPTTT